MNRWTHIICSLHPWFEHSMGARNLWAYINPIFCQSFASLWSCHCCVSFFALHDKMLFRSVSLLSGLDNKISKVLSCFIWGGGKIWESHFSVSTEIRLSWGYPYEQHPGVGGCVCSCRGQRCPGHRTRPLGVKDVGWPDVWTINSIGYI